MYIYIYIIYIVYKMTFVDFDICHSENGESQRKMLKNYFYRVGYLSSLP